MAMVGRPRPITPLTRARPREKQQRADEERRVLSSISPSCGGWTRLGNARGSGISLPDLTKARRNQCASILVDLRLFLHRLDTRFVGQCGGGGRLRCLDGDADPRRAGPGRRRHVDRPDRPAQAFRPPFPALLLYRPAASGRAPGRAFDGLSGAPRTAWATVGPSPTRVVRRTSRGSSPGRAGRGAWSGGCPT